MKKYASNMANRRYPVIVVTFLMILALMLIVACTNFRNTHMPEESPNAADEKTVVTKADLEGYWHSAPDFSQGEQETYEFYESEYACFHKNADGDRNSNRYEGTYNVNNHVLELSLYEEGDLYKAVNDRKYSEYKYNIDSYIENDTATQGPAFIIDGQKFWRMDRPDDFIEGSPLYINYPSLDGKEYQSRQKIKAEITGEIQNFIAYCNTDLYNIRINKISLVGDDNSGWDFTIWGNVKYRFKDVVYHLDKLSSDQYLDYTGLFDIGRMPTYAISFSDSEGKVHAYVFLHGGRVIPILVGQCQLA